MEQSELQNTQTTPRDVFCAMEEVDRPQHHRLECIDIYPILVLPAAYVMLFLSGSLLCDFKSNDKCTDTLLGFNLYAIIQAYCIIILVFSIGCKIGYSWHRFFFPPLKDE
ncbi:MAG: hypothetical protein MHMPM18_002555 [Marteilia pararefringens]